MCLFHSSEVMAIGSVKAQHIDMAAGPAKVIGQTDKDTLKSQVAL